ncbi:MAG: nucleotidyltransferase family protein [Nanoarchaeota archaeon]|nr:nucleotidyltransferase family protein [Nanoarchaeota archaeon]MBU1622609.1 nucleotidyltransferase family protein [Nanoarchaeota archaeon]MBU1974202.1 nucleotidyltransferase family protein [Nanoarchaeota archaeon]
MKALILAAGYATRLYPLTENQPKPLLKVGNKVIIEHILDKLKEVSEVEEILVVTNARFHHDFQIWLNHYDYPKKIRIINDGTLNNEDRLGAVGDINYVLKEEDIKDNLLVIAGDNLFGFSLKNFYDFFNQQEHGSVVAFHDLKDVEKVRKKFGVGILEGKRVIGFEEKPAQPNSTLASTCCYVFHKNDLHLVEKSIELGRADNTGDLIKFLTHHSTVHGYVFDEHWFDIGSHESLQEANEVYRNED